MGSDLSALPPHLRETAAQQIEAQRNRGQAPGRRPRGRAHAGRKTSADRMNKTEAAYADHLRALLDAGEIAEFAFEPVKLRLADRTWYLPDFRVVRPDGTIELHEVKGFWEDDARVKIKVAAELHPYRFVAAQKVAAKHGGGWKYETFCEAAHDPGQTG